MTVKILFVCMGNICRSPAAEAVMRKLIAEHGLEDEIIVDSAGTINLHAGEFSDSRMKEVALERGYEMTHLARQVRKADFQEFDYIVAMDDSNIENLRQFTPKAGAKAKVSRLLDHCRESGACEVPDPYYGGRAGFVKSISLIEQGCGALLDKVISEHKLSC